MNDPGFRFDAGLWTRELTHKLLVEARLFKKRFRELLAWSSSVSPSVEDSSVGGSPVLKKGEYAALMADSYGTSRVGRIGVKSRNPCAPLRERDVFRSTELEGVGSYAQLVRPGPFSMRSPGPLGAEWALSSVFSRGTED